MTSVQKRRGKALEVRTAAASGGTLVPYSGAGKISGDVHTDLVFMECKSSASRAAGQVKSIGLRKDWLTKMLTQQAKEGKPLHALVIHFSGDQRDWVCMSWDQWAELLNVIEAYRDGRLVLK